MKGICFIEPMFNAIINGSKTQTRRVINKKTLLYCGINHHLSIKQINEKLYGKSRYKVGEVLYLKEPYVLLDDGQVLYRRDDFLEYDDIVEKSQWKNKLFMPQKYARCFIKITAVMAEKLQDISDEDCVREGIRIVAKRNGVPFRYAYGFDISSITEAPKEAYSCLIDKINGKGTWDRNPLVWVYDFELIKK
jgi:hypothetical protein